LRGLLSRRAPAQIMVRLLRRRKTISRSNLEVSAKGLERIWWLLTAVEMGWTGDEKVSSRPNPSTPRYCWRVHPGAAV
jgi:hypothetical protein